VKTIILKMQAPRENKRGAIPVKKKKISYDSPVAHNDITNSFDDSPIITQYLI
jgi:hypothetical protein